LNPDVTEGTVKKTICVPGYTKSVRPATSYTNGVKAKLLTEAGIDHSRIGDFELDHIVPLALGGHPRKLSNLVLQPWEGEHGAKRKDSLEVRMHSLVCHGEVGLTEAQGCIAENWELCAAKYTTALSCIDPSHSSFRSVVLRLFLAASRERAGSRSGS